MREKIKKAITECELYIKTLEGKNDDVSVAIVASLKRIKVKYEEAYNEIEQICGFGR